MTKEQFATGACKVVVKIVNAMAWFYGKVKWFILETIRFFKYVFAFK